MNYEPTYNELKQKIAVLEAENKQMKELTDWGIDANNWEGNYFLIFEKMVSGGLLLKFENPQEDLVQELKIINSNNAFAEITRIDKKDIIGRNFSEIAPHSSEIYQRIISKADKVGVPYQLELFDRFLQKDLQIVALKIKENLLLLMFNDITEQRKKDKAALEVDNRLRIIAQNIDSIFWLAERNNAEDIPKVLYVSPNIEAISGYTPENAYADPFLFYKIIYPEDRNRLTDILANDSFKRNQIFDEEYRIFKSDGSIIWVWVRLSPIEFEDGVATKISGILSDITEKKQIEQELIVSRKLLHDIIDNTGNILISVKDINNKILLVNQTYCDYYQLKKEDITDIKYSEIIPEKYLELEVKYEKEIISTKKPIRYENKICGINENLNFLITKSPLINDLDEVYAICNVSTNITDIRQTEIELIKAKEKAEESDKLKSAFLANMSHEIRTPMNSIIGFTEVLLGELTSEEHLQFLNIIYKSGRHLLMLINDIIDISKIESGQIKANENLCSLNEMIKDLLVFHKSDIINQGKFEIQLNIFNGLEDQASIIIVDDLRLNQILTNLISNAIKFTKKGLVEWGYSLRNDQYLEFFVRDTGIGIAEDKHNLIFQRFSQADNSITRKFGGTGLGLAISRGLVELMGGKIWLNSSKGEGTTFYFTIPYKKGVLDDVNNKNTSSNNFIEYNWGSKTILIVEDEMNNFYYLKTLLKRTNVIIIHAQDGLKAIDVFKQNPSINLILMDIQLPRLSGIEVTRIIKSLKPQMPIIVQSANAMVEDRNILFAAGCDEYFTKPIQSDLLLKTLNEYFFKSK